MTLSPDDIVLCQWGPFTVNATLLNTWLVMLLLVLGSHGVTRRLRDEGPISRWQNFLEILVVGLCDQIHSTSRQAPEKYLGFIGTLFLFIATANLLGVIPGFEPPTGSLSTTAALALAVLAAVPVYGIAQRGPRAYFADYLKPSVFMLPMNILGEISRTVALAMRLYGNVMSGGMVGAILLLVAPFFLPIPLQLLGLVTALVQAYIFAILAMVFIASAQDDPPNNNNPGDRHE